MAVDQPSSANAAEGQPGGLPGHARELFASVLEYLQARLALAGIEAKEALIHFVIIVALLAAAAGVCVFGYLFLCIAATVLVARLLNVSPGWVILALAIIHFLVAICAALIAVTRLKGSVFTETMAELRKDQEWLNRPK
ncbi:MAG: phage holin family protein [Chthoniobacteraceae bacterium]|jgi:uncharacterized membrane protein YqjE